MERVEASGLAVKLPTVFTRWRRQIAAVLLWGILGTSALATLAQTLSNKGIPGIIHNGQVLATRPDAKDLSHIGDVPVSQTDPLVGQIKEVAHNSQQGAIEKAKQAQDIEKWL